MTQQTNILQNTPNINDKWSLPLTVEVQGRVHAITKKCDYRVVLDAICALNDPDYSQEEQVFNALWVFYEDHPSDFLDINQAIEEMFKIIAYGETELEDDNKPKLMDWEKDFTQLIHPVNRVLGYDVRTPDTYTHWYTFLSGYFEMGGDCTFQTIISIRSKLASGKKLDDTETEFYRRNKKLVDLPQQLSQEEQEWLDADW